ncbi:MAG: hypothetical protein RIB54_02605 [Fulvivirga sp.]|uniref:hypothetical protein n=2 Tax=Fulvivirga sp. TaxID=1931237 RepID=UPI0032EA93E4
MKQLLLLPLLAIAFSACEITVVEDPVPVIINDSRDRFTGFFDAEEYSKTARIYTYYTIRVVKSSGNNNVVFIRNFYGLDIEVFAEVHGNDIFIPEQDVEGYHIEGDGYLDGGELILYYSVFDHLDPHAHTDFCETVAFR